MFWNQGLRKGGFALAIMLGLAVASGSAWSQFKVYSKFIANPAATTTPLIFDVNNDTTDNVSPNVVFTQDMQRGFVSYTGVGEVLEFSLLTGQGLNRIKTGGSPFYATQLPDQHTLVISSALDSKLFVIDTNAPSHLVATYNFANAQFGFGSIVTLSPDGSIGYVSSTGTGEIIKFRISDGLEIGRFRGLRWPNQVTVTPDGSTLLAVDTDLGHPEISIFDTSSFAKKASVGNPDTTKYFVGFSIFNRVVIGPDGKTAIVASRGRNNVSYNDVFIVFNVADGKILKVGQAGPGPTWTGLTPDGKKWVIINMFSVTVVSTEDYENTAEFPAPVGESLGSANMVFSSDSKFGYYTALGTTFIKRDNVLQIDLETGSYLEMLQVGDSPDVLLDQPSSMAISNDGKILCAVEFASNNIDLMTPITRVAGGKFYCSPDTFSGISLLNLSAKETTITMYAMQDFGEPNQETGVRNPATFKLGPNQQVSYTVEELFNFDDNNAPNQYRSGWVAVYSDEPEITGYMTIGKKDFTQLNGFPLDRDPVRLHDWVLPTVNRNGDATVDLSTLNDTYYNASYNISRVGKDGVLIDTKTSQTAGGNYRVGQTMPDIFPRDHLDTEGYLWLTSPEGVFSHEVYGNGVSSEIITGIDREKYVGIKNIYAPQFATVSGWITTLNLINANENSADVTVTFHAGDGSVLFQFKKTFARGEQLRDDVVNLFNNPPANITVIAADPNFLNTSGWIEAESTQERILGLVTFNATDGHFSASFELSGTPLDNFIFPIVSQNEEYETGVALLNSNADPAQVVLELRDMDGSILATSPPVTLAPQTRTSVYLNSLFPNLGPVLMGNLRIRSDKAVYGFGIVNDSGFNFVMAMPPLKMF